MHSSQRTAYPTATLLLAVFALCPALSQAENLVALEPVFTHLALERPTALALSPETTPRRFLVEQTGKIKILPSTVDGEAPVFLDFSDRNMAAQPFEEGLLGLAFHPRYQENGRLFVYYSQQGPKRSVLSELRVSPDNPNQVDASSEKILLEIQQPEWNHNSGNLLFGPSDGFLYIAVGDGGLRNGVHMLAQKLSAWNGKILRIDVDSTSANRPYGIPADNPFASTPHAAPEIYALGLRNPWGIWIDPQTNEFWLADVGQDLWEEVNLIQPGANYGWEFREGTHRFEARDRLMDALGMSKKSGPPQDAVFIDPVWEYTRSDGISITGGYVYRGSKVPSIQDHYLVADWGTGKVWALQWDRSAGKVLSSPQIYQPTLEEALKPTGIVPDLDGEPLILNWDGRIFRITPPQA